MPILTRTKLRAMLNYEYEKGYRDGAASEYNNWTGYLSEELPISITCPRDILNYFKSLPNQGDAKK